MHPLLELVYGCSAHDQEVQAWQSTESKLSMALSSLILHERRK